MSTLLISMLGGAAEGEERRGHQTARYRLPGGERIVETSHLGIELARALQATKLALVGTPGAYFDQLLDLLPEEDRAAPVQETAPGASSAEDAAASPEEPEAQAQDTASEGDEENPPPAAADDAPAAETAPAEPPSPEAAEGPDPVPAPAREEQSTTEMAASPPPPEAPGADPTPPPEPRLPRKAHEPDTRSLEKRIAAQVDQRRPDRDAMQALAERLAAVVGIPEVRCVLISEPTESRSFQAAVRTLSEIPATGDLVHIDATYGPRTFPLLGVMALHYFKEFRPDITVGSVFEGSLEHADRTGVTTVTTLDGPFELMSWMSVFADLRDGRAPGLLLGLLNHDRRLQRLAGPYVRYQRGVQFGGLSEVIEGARLLEERRRRTGRLPYAHPYRLFDAVLQRALAPFLADVPASLRQLLLAQHALDGGHLPYAALHLREALVSACIEAYGRNPARAWIDVPQSGGIQQVRPRDVAGFILSTDAAQRQCPDLTTAWPLLATARNRYVNTSPTTVPASQLKDQDHEIRRLADLVATIVDEGRLAALPEAVPFDEAVKHAIDLRAIRPREGRRPRRKRGGGEGPGPREPRPRGDGRPAEGRGGGRGPARDRRGGPRDTAGGSHRRPPRPDPADTTPRVTSAGGGLGNLGLALAQAGVGGPSRGRGPKTVDREETDRREATEPPAASEATASPDAGPPAPAQQEPAAPPPEPRSAPEAERKPDEGPAGFDVAGPPAEPPPA